MPFAVARADSPAAVPGTFGQGGSTPALVVDLGQAGDVDMNADCASWLGTVLVTSPDAEWDDASGISFTAAGVYEILMDGFIDASDQGFWPQSMTRYGGAISTDEGNSIDRGDNWFTGESGVPQAMGITGLRYSDRFTFEASAGEALMPRAYTFTYAGFGPIVHTMQLTVRRLGAAA